MRQDLDDLERLLNTYVRDSRENIAPSAGLCLRSVSSMRQSNQSTDLADPVVVFPVLVSYVVGNTPVVELVAAFECTILTSRSRVFVSLMVAAVSMVHSA